MSPTPGAPSSAPASSAAGRRSRARFRARAVAGFGAVLLTTITLVVVAVLSLRASGARQEQALSASTERLLEARRLELTAEEMVASAKAFLLTGETEDLQKALTIEARFERELATLLARAEGTPEQETLTALDAAGDHYRAVLARLLANSAGKRDRSRVTAQLHDLFAARDQLKAHTQGLVELRRHRLAQAQVLAQRERDRASTLILALGAQGLVISGLLAWLTTVRLARIYAEEQQATRRAEEAIEARNQLLAVVAHDLRSPLSAIVNNAALIQRVTLCDRTSRHARSIEDISMRMGGLIKNLLDAAAVESGGLSVRPQPTAVAPLVRTTVDLFATLADRRSIRIDQKVEPSELEACCDPDRTMQVLSNLLSNALDFAPHGGQVKVRVFPGHDCVRFEVEDNGPGMRPEHLPHVFDRYWKTEGGGHRGAGLGLFIAKSIVEGQGGRIWPESQLHAGTTMCFELPRVSANPGSPQATDRPAPAPVLLHLIA